jgi:hypothetical protein
MSFPLHLNMGALESDPARGISRVRKSVLYNYVRNPFLRSGRISLHKIEWGQAAALPFMSDLSTVWPAAVWQIDTSECCPGVEAREPPTASPPARKRSLRNVTLPGRTNGRRSVALIARWPEPTDRPTARAALSGGGHACYAPDGERTAAICRVEKPCALRWLFAGAFSHPSAPASAPIDGGACSCIGGSHRDVWRNIWTGARIDVPAV